MIQPSLAASLAQLQAFANYLDTGSANATFVFYNDVKPASLAVAANDAAKLVTCTLPKPCFNRVLADGIELHPTDVATVIKTGTATWVRLFNGAGEATADFEIGADIMMADTALVAGGTLSIPSIILEV